MKRKTEGNNSCSSNGSCNLEVGKDARRIKARKMLPRSETKQIERILLEDSSLMSNKRKHCMEEQLGPSNKRASIGELLQEHTEKIAGLLEESNKIASIETVENESLASRMFFFGSKSLFDSRLDKCEKDLGMLQEMDRISPLERGFASDMFRKDKDMVFMMQFLARNGTHQGQFVQYQYRKHMNLPLDM